MKILFFYSPSMPVKPIALMKTVNVDLKKSCCCFEGSSMMGEPEGVMKIACPDR